MIRPLNTNKSSPAPAPGGSPICWQNCWQNCWQKQSLKLQTDEIPRRPKGLRRNDKQRRGCEDTRMIRPLNTNKSSPRSRGGGSPICWQNCWQKQSLHLQADEIPRRPMGLRRNDKQRRGLRRAGAQFCWQNCWPNCWPNCWQKQSLNLQTDEIPPRPKGLRRNDKRGRGHADDSATQHEQIILNPAVTLPL
jgi:hypothetical protein